MRPQLQLIDSASYAREVLPLTAPLWAAGRDLDTYVRHTLELASSGYGRRHYSTIGLYDGNVLSASCKRYERELRVGERTLKAVGIGAVFTPPEMRGRGYASAMLATLMDREHAAGLDALFLFSDIEPAFYETLGFLAFPSRVFSLRADDLPHARMTIKQATPEDLAGVRRSFARHERMRPWSFKRTPLFWEWLYLRTRHGSEHPNGDALTFVLREGSRVDAYVTGVRSPAHDSFIVDELGLRDER
ncbi:MAG: GNAT family N-acetyltransferase, partial [Candidatus Eremiobacteraeota bacterium]|nr:GNAT family N-acetyltransferase [Candidatus Eremiobacteraeota bacterium]